MTRIAETIARLQEPDPTTPTGRRSVRVKDLEFVISEFRRIQKLVDRKFVDLQDGATRLITTEAVPMGHVVVTDADGKVIFAGPMQAMPSPSQDSPAAITINLHPQTKALIDRASSSDNEGESP